MLLDGESARIEIEGEYAQWNIPSRKLLPCATKGVDEELGYNIAN